MRTPPAIAISLLVTVSGCVDPTMGKAPQGATDTRDTTPGALDTSLGGETGGVHESGSGEGEGESDSGNSDASPSLAVLNELGVRNIILIHSDTMRADQLPIYGNPRETAPNLVRDASLVVLDYEAAAPWTLPSTSSALFGLSPEHHGNVRISGGSGAGAATSIAEQLQSYGYATGAFSGSRVIAGDDDLARGFNVAVNIADLDDVESQCMASLWAGAETWLDGLGPDQPFFLWLQPMDTHPPYRPREPYRGTWAEYDVLPFDIGSSSVEQEEEFEAAYEAAGTDAERAQVVQSTLDVYNELILQEDAPVADIFSWLEATGHQEDTLVVFTADHGETIADDRQATLSHMESVRPELLRLPLVFYHPALTGEVAPCRSSNIDLAPTLLEALGIEAIAGIDGQPLQEGCRTMTRASLYVNEAVDDILWMLSVSDDTYKMEWNCVEGTASLYDLAADPATLSPLDMATVPTASVYWDDLSAYLEEALLMNPALTCDLSGVEPPAGS